MHHLYRVLEFAAKDPDHDLSWAFPVLGVQDPDSSKISAGFAPAEAAALAAYHKEQHLLEQVKKSYRSKGEGGGESSSAGSQEKSIAAQVREAVKEEVKRKVKAGKDKDKGYKGKKGQKADQQGGGDNEEG